MKRIISLGTALIFLVGLTLAQGKVETAKIKVKGITCDHCTEEVKEALINLKGVSNVEFEKTDFKNQYGIISVKYDPTQVDYDKLVYAINETGFEPEVPQVKETKKETGKVEGVVAKINVKGIECGACVKSVENSLKKVDGVKSVEFEKKDFKKQEGVVKVAYDPSKTKLEDLENAILKAGFSANDKSPEKKKHH